VVHAQQLNPEIRAVLVAAQLEQGMSAAETARAAQAGDLEGLPPTRVGETTCRNLARAAERERGAQSTGDETVPGPANPVVPIDAIATRAQAILEREMTRLEERSEDGLRNQDATALKRLLQIAREVKAIDQLGSPPGLRTRRLVGEHGEPAKAAAPQRSPITDAVLGLKPAAPQRSPIMDAVLGLDGEGDGDGGQGERPGILASE
jgi:hypothetical protein